MIIQTFNLTILSNAVRWCREVRRSPIPAPQNSTRTRTSHTRACCFYGWAGTGFVCGKLPGQTKAPATDKAHDDFGCCAEPTSVGPSRLLVTWLTKPGNVHPDDPVTEQAMRLQRSQKAASSKLGC